LLPFFLYEDLLLAAIMFGVGLMLTYFEKINEAINRLDWREYLFFIYMFHMLFGEREFAYLGIEPLFVTEIVLVILTVAYAKDLLKIRRELFIYYLIVLIGFGFAFVYFFQHQLDAVRDSFMLIYAFWVPIVYYVFRGRNHYQLFFLFLKLFIVLKAIAYCYEAAMIILGYQRITFEGFRFGVGYILPSLIVIAIFPAVQTHRAEIQNTWFIYDPGCIHRFSPIHFYGDIHRTCGNFCYRKSYFQKKYFNVRRHKPCAPHRFSHLL